MNLFRYLLIIEMKYNELCSYQFWNNYLFYLFIYLLKEL